MRSKLTGGASPEVPLIIHAGSIAIHTLALYSQRFAPIHAFVANDVAGRLTVEKQSEKLPDLFEAISIRLDGQVRFAIFGDGTERNFIE